MTTVPVRLVRGLMWLVLTLLVLAAIAISGLRLFLPQLNEFREPIRQWASEQAGMSLQIDSVEGHWRSIGPSLMLQGIDIAASDNSESLASIGSIDMQLDIWQSALKFRPIFKNITINQLGIDLTQIPGLDLYADSSQKVPSKQPTTAVQKLERLFFIRLGDFSLTDSKVSLLTPAGEKKQVDISELKWVNVNGEHLAEGVISIADTHLSQLKVIANLSEKGDLPSLSGHIYAQAQNLSITPWLNKQLTKGTEITSSDIGFEVWLDLFDGEITNSRVQIENSKVEWKRADQLHSIQIQQGVVALTPTALTDDVTAWRVDSDDLKIQTDNTQWPDLDLVAQWQPEKWMLAVNSLDIARLQSLASFFPADNSAVSMLNTLRPTGNLTDIRVASTGEESPRFSAKLKHFGMQQWELLPGISKLDADISGDLASGKAVLKLKDDALPYGEVFQAPLKIDNADVTAYWQVNDQGWRLWSDKLHVATPHLKVDGEFRLDFPAEKPAWLSFYGEASLNNAGEAWRYLPTLALGRDLTDYLSAAIRGGKADAAQLLWYGELSDFPYKNHEGIFQAKVPLKKAKFSFDTTWPILTDLQLDLLFENDFMYLDSHHAVTMGATASRVTGASELSPDGHLKLTVDVAAQGDAVRDYMLATPLVDSVGAALTTVKVSGPVTSRFKLDIPFDGTDVRAWGTADFKDNQIAIETPAIQLANVNGQLSFDNDVIKATDLKGFLLEQPINVGFNGKSVDTGYTVDIDLGGNWQVGQLQQQLNDPLLNHVSGQTQWQGAVGVNLYDTGFNYTVDLQAPLSRINSNLPYPLTYEGALSPKQLATVKVTGNAEVLSGEIVVPDAKYQAQISLLQSRPVIKKSFLSIGKGELKPLPLSGHQVRVNSNRINGDQWIDLINEITSDLDQAEATGKKQGMPQIPMPTQLDIQLKTLTLASRDWHDLTFNAQRKLSQWGFTLDSREVKGSAVWVDNNPLKLTLDNVFLNFPKLLSKDKQDKTKYVPQRDIPEATELDKALMTNMPEMDLQVNSMWLQGYSLGKVSGKLRKDNNTLVLQNLQVKSGATALNLDAHWTLDGDQNETQIAFDVEGENSSDLMGRFGISGGIQDASFSSYASIQWQGSPWSIHRETLTGEIKTETGQGIISGVGGAGRLLGLFSLDSIMRKLQLDFSGVFDDGLAFNYIKGSGKIENGIFNSDNIKMQALAGDLTIKGSANLVNETVNAQVRFTPDFTSGIPVLTAFAVAPQTALYVFAISTALSPVLDVFTQVNYLVKGPLDSPTVTERSRFKGEVVVPESIDNKK